MHGHKDPAATVPEFRTAVLTASGKPHCRIDPCSTGRSGPVATNDLLPKISVASAIAS